MQKLRDSRVAVFGIGGVGAACVEGLVRAGVGHLVLVDDDLVCLTNLNRQLHATHKTVGSPKVEAMRDRILDINPQADVVIHQRFYLPDCAEELVRPEYDYIVDAIDTVTAKIDLVKTAQRMGIPIISCMGAGNKLDPTAFQVADIYQTTICPLARVMRRELRRQGVTSLKVVYSREVPMVPQFTEETSCDHSCICPKGSTRTCTIRRQVPGSVSFVPAVAGFILAGEVIKDLTGFSVRTMPAAASRVPEPEGEDPT